MRSHLEPLAVHESLQFLSPTLIEELEQLNTQMKQVVDDAEAYIQLNIQFHNLLIQDCPWEKLNAMIENLWNGFPQQTPHLLPKQITTSIAKHDEIIQALRQNDIEEACKLLKQHILRAKYDVLQNMKL